MGPPFLTGWFQLHSWSAGGIPGAAGEKPGDLPSRTFLKMRLSRASLGQRRGLPHFLLRPPSRLPSPSSS